MTPSIKNVHVECDDEPQITNDLPSFDINNELSPTSDSYTVPGSSGTMKETHIFTPIKPYNIDKTSTVFTLDDNINNTNSNIVGVKCDGTFSNNSIVINESVVRKEYRDIDYDTSKLTTTNSDDFTEFQFAEQTTLNLNDKISIEPHASSLTITNSQSSVNCDMESTQQNSHSDSILDEFDAYTTRQPNSIMENRSMKPSNEFREHCDNIKVNHIKHNDFTVFSMNADKTNAHQHGKSDTEHSTSAINSSNAFQLSSSQLLSMASPINSQSTSITAVKKPEENPVTRNHISDSFGILIPQTVNSSSISTIPLDVQQSVKIEWPEPGLNSKQLAQLEKRLPKSSEKHESNHNANDDDEWSDFVSVTQPQTPITNILNENLLKQQNHGNDEDDWSEFVSSTSSSTCFQQQPTQQRYSSAVNNLKPEYTIHSNALYSNMTEYNVGHSNTNGYQTSSSQQTIAPSIISLPDLRFVAPKSLVNMPKRSLAKK